MSKDYGPIYALWALVSGALDNAEEHISASAPAAEVLEIKDAGNFEVLVKLKDASGTRRFRVKVWEMRP